MAGGHLTKQPASTAVTLGGSATLQVTASAPTPLPCQWQFNGADLATGSWQSDELDFATNATTVSSAPQQYFRVLQLGQ